MGSAWRVNAVYVGIEEGAIGVAEWCRVKGYPLVIGIACH